jgi:hypothetical protein
MSSKAGLCSKPTKASLSERVFSGKAQQTNRESKPTQESLREQAIAASLRGQAYFSKLCE